jgi:hypothetical protein
VEFARVWAMPNKQTFTIAPITRLLKDYGVDTGVWADPFAGNNSPAMYTNDLNPNTTARSHVDFRVFLSEFAPNVLEGLLFDPPYSVRQIKECYDSFGLKMAMEESQKGFYHYLWKEAIRLKPQYIIQCGWHTNGRKEYYNIVEILMVVHGGSRYDTLVSVWQKHPSLDQYF